MLYITVPGGEWFNDKTQEFITTKQQTLQLEHSLVSISKWESKWEKSFLSSNDKNEQEILDYIRCMTITQNVDPNVYLNLTQDNINDVNHYINAKMTATFFNGGSGDNRPSREIITSELIYYWMIAQNIPMSCEKWHLNRLLTLIKVCSIKNTPPKKMKTGELMSRNAALNAARRKQMNSKG